jgi:hypothetical protein
MGEALWPDLDAWQSQILSPLMDEGLFPTLTVKMVVATLVRNYSEWDNPAVWTFPAIIVSSSTMRRPATETMFGDGIAHYRKHIPYRWFAVVEGDSFTSERDAKVLEKRLETLARQLVAGGWGAGSAFPLVADDSGERLSTITVGDSAIARYPRGTEAQADPWFGVAMLDIELVTTV